METPTLRVLVGGRAGVGARGLGVRGDGAAHQSAQDCHERWDDVPEADADCEDALHELMTWAGALVWVFGLALLWAAAREHYGQGATPEPGQPS